MACAQKIGYPIMLKASWGGGGKGIRKCSNDEEVITAFKQVLSLRISDHSIALVFAITEASFCFLIDTWKDRDCAVQ